MFSWKAGLCMHGVSLQFQSLCEKLRTSQELPSEQTKAIGIGEWPPPMGTPYWAVGPQIEQDHGAESSVFSSPGGVSTISSLHIHGHLQTGALNTKWQGRSREIVMPIPNLHLPRSLLDFCWDWSSAVPWLISVSLSTATVTSLSDKIQKSFAFFAGKTSSLYSIIHFTYMLFMCNVEVIFGTFLAFIADISETHRSLRHRCDARRRVTPFAETSTYEGVKGMRTASLLFRVNPL